MKTARGTPQGARREQLLDDPRHDSYKSKVKLPEPTRCPACGAAFHKGRWTWNVPPGAAHEQLCPACRRIEDGFPAGYVTLGGEFFASHRDEILSLARNCEASEKAEHPLQRIIAIEDGRDGTVIITTTDVHLARRIAESIHSACKGHLELKYGDEDNLLRAAWSR